MVTPQCPYFGICGGCTTQHIEYAVQVENKRKALASLIGFDDVRSFCGSAYAYRNRMDLIFHAKGIGFRKKGAWQTIIDIESCAISDDVINTLIAEIRSHFDRVDAFDLRKQRGTFKFAVIRTTSTGESSVSFVLNKDSTRVSEATDLIESFAKQTTATHILVTFVAAKTDTSISDDYYVIKGKDMLEEQILGKRLRYAVQGFFQNNYAMASKLQEYCRGLLTSYPTKDAHLLDLYGGVGAFGIINADLFNSVHIVESVQPCIDAALENMKLNGVTNATAQVLDAQYLKRLTLPSPLYLITDPPRSGMHIKTIEQIEVLQPEVIIYISCNIQQLAKELGRFKSYRVKSAALFDLFPQTNHGEGVVELVKINCE